MDIKSTESMREGHYIDSLDVKPGDHYDEGFEANVTRILVRLGEDLNREGLKQTPQRVAKAFDFLTSGYNMTVEKVSPGCPL